MHIPSLHLRTASLTILIVACCWAISEAQTVKKDQVVSGLNFPCGVAVDHVRETVFFSDSGHGEILRLIDGKAEKVVTGYNVQASETELGWRGGPLGIGIMSGTNQLVVGSGGAKLGEDRVDIFELANLPSTVPQATLTKTLPATASPHGKPQGDFYGVAADSNQAWLTGRGNPDYGWVYHLTAAKDETPARLRCQIDTWKGSGTRLPTAITLSPDGYILVGQRGANGNDSVIAFYDRVTGDARAKFSMGRTGIVALAYHPTSGRLYGLFNDPKTPETNGLYKLVARNRNTLCETQLITRLTDPWAMAFAANGDLWVTAGKEDGGLWKLSGFEPPPESESN